LTDLPTAIVSAARDPYLARTLIFALLLSDDEALRQEQARLIATMAEPGVDQYLRSLHTIIVSLGAEVRLPLVSLAMPALRSCSAQQIKRFINVMKRLIRVDSHVSLYEWCLATVVQNGVDQQVAAQAWRGANKSLQQLAIQARLILSLLAQSVAADRDVQRQAYAMALKNLGIVWQPAYEKTDIRFEIIDHALRQLDRLQPLAKQNLLDACKTLILQDAQVTVCEHEVLSAIAAALHCPVPLLTAE
jgi:hypothetical protein